MSTRIIVLSSAIGAIVLATTLAIAEVMNAPRSDIGTILMPHLPVLVVGALGVYGLGAMLLTDHKLGRQYYLDAPPSGARRTWPNAAWHDWIAALAQTGSGNCKRVSAGRTGDRG